MDESIDLSRLKALSTQIVTCVDELAVYAEDNDKKYQSRMQLFDNLAQAEQIITSGLDFITQLASQNNQFHCIRWLLHFNILPLIPLSPNDSTPLNSVSKEISSSSSTTLPTGLHDGLSVSFTQVAEQARVPENQLRRISRMAMLRGFLCEPVAGRVAHTPLSAAFARSASLSAWGRFVVDISAPMVTKMVEATERWGHGVATSPSPPPLPANATAYNIAWDTELPFFQHISANPELGRRYAEYLRHMTVNRAVALDHLVNAFPSPSPTASVAPTVVVDVGGGLGQASFALVAAYPHLRCLVQDLPEVVARAEARVASSSSTASPGDTRVQDMVAFEAHDFFKPQPARLPIALRQRWQVSSPSLSQTDDSEPLDIHHDRDVDIFLLRQILHDWQDDEAVAILRSLVPRIRPTGRIVVMDTMLPEPLSSEGIGKTLSKAEEAGLRVRDLTMLQTYNAQERDLMQWETLFAKADVGLRLAKVSTPQGSHMSILEIMVDGIQNNSAKR